jgi:predicted nucleotidyltransferase
VSVESRSDLDATVDAYIADILDAVEDAGDVTVLASYVVGSRALGGVDAERSDLDLVVVVDQPFGSRRQRVVDAVDRLGRPGRALELVVYVRGEQPPDFELNVNVDATGARELRNEPWHWFVIDAAIGQERSTELADADPPWSTFFDPIGPERLDEALLASIAWSERQPPDNEFARLNAIRSRHKLEHGEWMSKSQARQAAS